MKPYEYYDYLWGSLKGITYKTIHTQGTSLKEQSDAIYWQILGTKYSLLSIIQKLTSWFYLSN